MLHKKQKKHIFSILKTKTKKEHNKETENNTQRLLALLTVMKKHRIVFMYEKFMICTFLFV